MTKVLVLSSSHEPLNICDWRRALSLITAGKATVLESYEAKAHGSDQRAAVIMLKRPHPLAGLYAGLDKRQPPRLAPSRRNILHRDGYACRYCKAHGPAVTLTLDHVTPRCQGGKNSWENLVTACSRCNNKKGGRNLEESGMSLTPVPHYPTNVAAFRASMFRKLGMSHPSWEKYLP